MHPAWHRSRWLPDFVTGPRRTLGFGVANWIELNCVHGPGDVQGQRIGGGDPDEPGARGELDDEWLRFLALAYEVDPQSGRRLCSEALLSRAKGRAKSEMAGWVALAEAFGDCVRFDRWDPATGQPVGRAVTSPLVKVLATEENQAGNTFEVIAYVAERGRSRRPDVFAFTGARQYQSASALYLPRGGELRACTSGSASKDGGLESFVVADETHLYVLPELRAMYATISRNLPKRAAAQPWLLQTTTAYRPGEQSVAESTLTAHRKGELGPGALVDHVQASGRIDLDDEDRTLRQLREAYGASVPWQDLAARYAAMRNPRVCRDVAEAARYFLNRPMSGASAWIDEAVVERQSRADVVAAGEAVALGFDGSLRNDATVLRGCRMSDGFLFTIGLWAKPDGPEGARWEVPRLDVLATIREAFARYAVAWLFADPPEWRTDLDALAEEFPKRVVRFETRLDVQMAAALDRLHTALTTGQVCHDGDPVAVVHYGNAYARRKGPLVLVRKEYPDSPRKIDTVVADALALEARARAIEAGLGRPRRRAAGF